MTPIVQYRYHTLQSNEKAVNELAIHQRGVSIGDIGMLVSVDSFVCPCTYVTLQ